MKQGEKNLPSYQDNEGDLRMIWNSVIEGKFLIFGLTIFVTILALLYSINISTKYQATSVITKTSDISLNGINKLIYVTETKESILSNFLTILSNQSFQKDIFLEYGFLSQFNETNKPIVNVDDFVDDVLKLITVICRLPNSNSGSSE